MESSRRDVLKAVSAASIVPMTGYLNPSSESRANTRLLEAGLRYELGEDADYHRINVDSRPLYAVNGVGGTLALRRPVPEAVAGAFGNHAELVRYDGDLPRPASSVQAGTDEVRGLVTELSTRKRPAEMVLLTEPHATPSVEFDSDSGQFVVDADGRTVELAPGADSQLRLEPRTVSAKVIEGLRTPREEHVPDERLGKVAEYGTRRIEVEPVLELQDLGDPSVVPFE